MTARLLNSSAGFTYIAALVMVVILGIMLGGAANVWKTRMQREREEELLFRGSQIRASMQRWYRYDPATGMQAVAPGQRQPLPLYDLKDLLEDSRSTEKRRYLRRLYKDPITGDDFENIYRIGTKEIIGVKSKSEAEPIKKANFPDEFLDFEGKTKYSEWEFVYNHVPRPGVTGGIVGAGGRSNPNTPSGK